MVASLEPCCRGSAVLLGTGGSVPTSDDDAPSERDDESPASREPGRQERGLGEWRQRDLRCDHERWSDLARRRRTRRRDVAVPRRAGREREDRVSAGGREGKRLAHLQDRERWPDLDAAVPGAR